MNAIPSDPESTASVLDGAVTDLIARLDRAGLSAAERQLAGGFLEEMRPFVDPELFREHHRRQLELLRRFSERFDMLEDEQCYASYGSTTQFVLGRILEVMTARDLTWQTLGDLSELEFAQMYGGEVTSQLLHRLYILQRVVGENQRELQSA